ncbi:hypothetical protein [Streptomyces sp. enrichment culture]|uniref:hypothetical protein n=1 Tax=Streptomyces sp. enrichment culture TaxID=1795815 RepID=UPI003F56D8BC
MMTDVIDIADTHPDRIPGYHDGPFARRPELLDQRLFWHGHLYSCAQGDAGRPLWGVDHPWAGHQDFQRRLWERGDWPAFTVPLAAGHRLHVVHRTVEGEEGVEYLVHHPDWDQADLIARDDGYQQSALRTKARQAVTASLGSLGPLHHGALEGGHAFGTEVHILYWLIGPVSPAAGRLPPHRPVAGNHQGPRTLSE